MMAMHRQLCRSATPQARSSPGTGATRVTSMGTEPSTSGWMTTLPLMLDGLRPADDLLVYPTISTEDRRPCRFLGGGVRKIVGRKIVGDELSHKSPIYFPLHCFALRFTGSNIFFDGSCNFLSIRMSGSGRRERRRGGGCQECLICSLRARPRH